MMYKLLFADVDVDFPSLETAMAFAKELDVFVTIKGDGFEIVGMFGVDSIKDGKCPDGIEYDWNKASRIGQAKRAR